MTEDGRQRTGTEHGPIVTTDQAARCLSVLRTADKFMTAAELADRLGLGGCHETRRRHVRALIRHLRDNGSMIVANNAEGYWLTTDTKIWDDYINNRAIDAKVMLAEVSRRKRMSAGGNGQGVLFDNRIPAGVATIEA